MYTPIHPLACLAIAMITALYFFWIIRVWRECKRRRRENDDYERQYGDYDIGI